MPYSVVEVIVSWLELVDIKLAAYQWACMQVLFVQRSYLQHAWKVVFVCARDFLSSLKIVFECGIAIYAGFEINNLALLGFCNKFYLIFFFFFSLEKHISGLAYLVWCPCGEFGSFRKRMPQLPLSVGGWKVSFYSSVHYSFTLLISEESSHSKFKGLCVLILRFNCWHESHNLYFSTNVL